MAKGDISIIVAIVILAFAISSLTYIYISPKIILTSNVATTTTSSPKACKIQSIPNTYQCNGNIRQQLFQQTDCNQIWVDQQYCQNGCSNGICLAATQTISLTTTTTHSTTTTSTTTSTFLTTTSTTTTATIPQPVPIKSNYLVGAYWWPNWDPTTPTSNWFDWRDTVYHPILGEYDARNITVIDYQIKWAVENGVSFFAVSFWEDRLQQGYFKADFLPYIKFAFDAPHELSTPLCTYSCVPDNTDPNIFATQTVYMSKYFNYSEYLKINGRPVVFIYIQPNWRAFTPSEESDLLARIRSMKAYDQQNGINPYLVGLWGISDGNFNSTSPSLNREFDAIAIYSAIAAGITGNPNDCMNNNDSSCTFDQYVSSMISLSKVWHDGVQSQGTTFIPDVMVGVNDSLSFIHGTRNYWAVRPTSTPDKASQLLAGVKPYVNSDNNIFMISDWNDWTEGSALEPTQEWGFGYLQAMKQNFAS
jgi:hypothetical protein